MAVQSRAHGPPSDLIHEPRTEKRPAAGTPHLAVPMSNQRPRPTALTMYNFTGTRDELGAEAEKGSRVEWLILCVCGIPRRMSSCNTGKEIVRTLHPCRD